MITKNTSYTKEQKINGEHLRTEREGLNLPWVKEPDGHKLYSVVDSEGDEILCAMDAETASLITKTVNNYYHLVADNTLLKKKNKMLSSEVLLSESTNAKLLDELNKLEK